MLTATGELDRAKGLVDDVLEHDASHVSALKLRAAWLIDSDEIDDAEGKQEAVEGGDSMYEKAVRERKRSV